MNPIDDEISQSAHEAGTKEELELVAAVREALEASAHVRQALLAFDDAARQSLMLVAQKNARPSELLDRMAAGEVRVSLSDAMSDLELARRGTRRAIIRLGITRGETIERMAQSLGISAPLAARLAGKRVRGHNEPLS